ncbi:MAG: phospholipid scramblase-related protein [Stackebrandtia sp.]
MSQQTPPGWYPDPSGSGQQRYFDGRQWTNHLHPGAGQQHEQLEKAVELDISGGNNPAEIQQQVQQRAGVGPVAAGGGTIFSESVLVVNQKAKLMELNSEYSVFDQHGRQVAAVVQVGQSTAQKALRLLTKYDNMMTHKLEIRDGHARALMRVTRPATMWKSKVIVERGDGMPIGEIQQQNMIGRVNFAIWSNGRQIGQIQGKNWLSWDFAISDTQGNRVASVNKTFGGMKTVFTTADNYVLSIHQPLQDPMLSMVVASALTIDTALHQASG